MIAGVDDAAVVGIVLVVWAIVAVVDLALYSQAPTWGNNALQIPDLNPKDNIVPFPAIPPTPKKEPQPIPSPEQSDSDKPKAAIYYHATTHENALLIWASGALVGSSYEAGHVFAWRLKPSKRAISLSGARGDTIISFKTYAAFSEDFGITDPYVKKYGPVRSVLSGRVSIFDVTILN